MTTTLVLYHADCIDGFCSAWQAWRELGDAAEYRAVRYGDPVPTDVEGRHVYVLDFCYPLDDTRKLIVGARSLTLLDHHKTAAAALDQLLAAPLPASTFITFDMERSGAGLTRDHFHLGGSRADSWVVDYVQDRDLWRFALPDSHEVNAYLHTLDFTFEAFEAAESILRPADAAALGQGVASFKSMYAKRMKAQAQRVTFAGYPDVPMVNAPFIGISELVNELAQGERFAVGWSQRADGKVMFSLRSVGEFDVSVVAQAYGGGGHKNAAGFTLDLQLYKTFPPVTS